VAEADAPGRKAVRLYRHRWSPLYQLQGTSQLLRKQCKLTASNQQALHKTTAAYG
jgi:hypothetical protein